MSILKRSTDLFPLFPSFFNDELSRDLWNWSLSNNSSTNTTIPAVNVKETADNFVVEMAAPGMQKDDFRIELDGNLLTITSESRREENREEDKYARKEFSYQSFQRTFQLPKQVVDAEHIEAKYENGVLHLLIPKKEEARPKPPRMIQVS